MGCTGDGFSVVINGNVYDESNPTGTEILPGQGGECDTTLMITLVFDNIAQAMISSAGPFCTEAGIQTLTASPPGGTWSGSVSSDQFDPALLGPGTHEVIYTHQQDPASLQIQLTSLFMNWLFLPDDTR
jgi:hypothetical protein